MPAVTWAKGLRRWTDFLSVSGRSERTIRSYRRTVVNFLADTLLELNEVTEDDVVAYVAALPARGATRGTVLRALRSYYGWAEARNVCESPVRRLKPKSEKYGPAPTLSPEELVRLLDAAGRRNPKHRWIVALLYATGGRAESIVHARAQDVRGDWLDFRVAKGQHPYSVKLGRLGREAVGQLATYGTPTLIGVGYGRLYQIVRQAGEDAGLHVWPHLLRHSFATEVARRTDPRTWQELMGHQDLSQYRRYVAVNEERLQAAVEEL